MEYTKNDKGGKREEETFKEREKKRRVGRGIRNLQRAGVTEEGNLNQTTTEERKIGVPYGRNKISFLPDAPK